MEYGIVSQEFFQLRGIVPHPAGCMRAQGYYKMSKKQKRGMKRRPGTGATEISERVRIYFFVPFSFSF